MFRTEERPTAIATAMHHERIRSANTHYDVKGHIGTHRSVAEQSDARANQLQSDPNSSSMWNAKRKE